LAILSYLLTGQWNIVKQVQFVEETTYGTTPSSPVGSRDIYAMVKTGEVYSFDVRF
jgi:hypothetical protein